MAFVKKNLNNQGRFIYPNINSPTYIPQNITRDWNQVQGTTGVEDWLWKIPNTTDVRHISIENSSQSQNIGVAIQTYYILDLNEVPKIQFVLKPGEIRDIAINSHGGPLQYIYLLNPESGKNYGKMVGRPSPLQTDGQQFVIRQGVNLWFTSKFKNAGYRWS